MPCFLFPVLRCHLEFFLKASFPCPRDCPLIALFTSRNFSCLIMKWKFLPANLPGGWGGGGDSLYSFYCHDSVCVSHANLWVHHSSFISCCLTIRDLLSLLPLPHFQFIFLVTLFLCWWCSSPSLLMACAVNIDYLSLEV